MNFIFQDRVPTYPNRYKVTKADGTSEFVTLERADEPTVVGTALNANTFNSAFREIEDKVGSGGVGGFVARNLLDNSDFTNPVNQRRMGSYSTNNAYTIDRWTAGSGSPFTLTLNKSGLSVSATDNRVQVRQRFQKGILSLDKSYTVAVYYVGEGLRLGNLESQDDLTNPYFFTSNEAFDSVAFYIRGNETVAWAAVYEGEYTAETLPEYQPKGYGAELLECQRYYQIRSSDKINAADMRPIMRLSSPTIEMDLLGYCYSADL